MDKKFKIFVIVALVALASLAATATVVAFKVMNKANQTASTEEGEKKENKELTLLPLKDAITANLAGEEDGYHIIRVQLTVGVAGKEKSIKAFEETFAAKEVTVRDAIIRVLRQQTYEMVMKQDAQDKIGEQLVNTLNELLETDVIEGVYFGDFFVQ